MCGSEGRSLSNVLKPAAHGLLLSTSANNNKCVHSYKRFYAQLNSHFHTWQIWIRLNTGENRNWLLYIAWIIHENPDCSPSFQTAPFSFSLALISSMRQQLSIFAKRFSQSLVLRGVSLPRIRHRKRAREAALMRCPQRCACTCAKGSRCSNPLPRDPVLGISSATWGQAEDRPPPPERALKSYFTIF